jgi:hypothetical protein
MCSHLVRLNGAHSESRYTQQCPLKVSPTQTNYSPDGRSLLYTSSGHQMFFMTYGKDMESDKESWHVSEKDGVRPTSSHPVMRSPADAECEGFR